MPSDMPDDELEAIGAAARRAGLVNIGIGGAAMSIGLVTGTTAIVGIAAGYIIGAVNISWLLRILRAGVNLDAQKAAASVARGYYVRFGATCVLFYLAISRGWFNPWQLITGFSASVFIIIGVLIFVASKTFRQAGETNPALKNVSKQRG